MKIDRPAIIRLIENDSRFDEDVRQWRYGYTSFETMLSIVLVKMMVTRDYVAEAEAMIEADE